MKKRLLLIPALSLILGACTMDFEYTPKYGGKYVPTEQETVEEELTCTWNFYASYSMSTLFDGNLRKDVATPIYSATYPIMKPIGECPEEVNSQDKVIALAHSVGFTDNQLDLETFDKFIGFSSCGVVVDPEAIVDGLPVMFNFEEEIGQQVMLNGVVNLYGVWVSEAK